jgi:hypothetical protein
MAFEVKKKFFFFESASVAADLTRSTDHAVAGDDDGDGIFSVTGAYGPHGLGLPQALGDDFVRCHLAEGDLGQGLPDGFLKLGAFGAQVEVEVGSPTREVFTKLTGGGG